MSQIVSEPVEHEDLSRSPTADAWHRLCRNHMAVAGGIYVIVLALASFLPWALGLSTTAQGLDVVAAPPGAHIIKIYTPGQREAIEYTDLAHLPGRADFPSGAAGEELLRHLRSGEEAVAPPVGDSPSLRYRPGRFWLGADTLGRDLLARILFGSRISLTVGLVATLVALVIGVTYGAISGFYGGKVDVVMMRIVDIIYALPFVIFVIVLMVLFGHNFVLLFFAIGAVEWLTMARIVRGQVLSVRKMEYIDAARTMGLSSRRIIFRHIIPNVLGPVIVYTTLTIPAVMLVEAFLSFLGLGVQIPMASLGSLIKDGADTMEEYWWLLVFPAVTFSLTLFSLNFLGDGLRDALDVRSAKD
ncbi:MAG TPA: ABC transporter permease [Opitutaceae bacterium]|jgi:oligopeptide transport system permease protein